MPSEDHMFYWKAGKAKESQEYETNMDDYPHLYILDHMVGRK